MKNKKVWIDGVTKIGNKWQAELKVQGKTYYLGYYPTKEEATEVYQKLLHDLNLFNKKEVQRI